MDFSGLFARPIHPELAGLARYMLELAGDEPLPRRSQFEFSGVSRLTACMFLVEVLPDDNDYYFSYSGELMPALFGGVDMGGLRLSEAGDPDLYQTLRKTYDRVVTTGLPLYMRGHYVWPTKSVPIERLLVPLAGDDGGVAAICGIVVPDILESDLDRFAGSGPARLVGVDELVLAA